MEMVWSKPNEGWVKVNFDGASKGNPGPFGAGWVARDAKGDLVAFKAKKITKWDE